MTDYTNLSTDEKLNLILLRLDGLEAAAVVERLDRLEQGQEVISNTLDRIVDQIAVLVKGQFGLATDFQRLDRRVTALEEKAA